MVCACTVLAVRFLNEEQQLNKINKLLTKMENGITRDELNAIGDFIEKTCNHEWIETENFYIKCKFCNKLREYQPLSCYIIPLLPKPQAGGV